MTSVGSIGIAQQRASGKGAFEAACRPQQVSVSQLTASKVVLHCQSGGSIVGIRYSQNDSFVFLVDEPSVGSLLVILMFCNDL